MIRVIDKNSTTQEVVQKLVSPYGRFIGYQYGIPGQGMTFCSTLTEARIAIGKTTPHNLFTKPMGRPTLSLPSHS